MIIIFKAISVQLLYSVGKYGFSYCHVLIVLNNICVFWHIKKYRTNTNETQLDTGNWQSANSHPTLKIAWNVFHFVTFWPNIKWIARTRDGKFGCIMQTNTHTPTHTHTPKHTHTPTHPDDRYILITLIGASNGKQLREQRFFISLGFDTFFLVLSLLSSAVLFKTS